MIESSALCGMMEGVEDQPGLNQPESRYEMEGECEFHSVGRTGRMAMSCAAPRVAGLQ